MIEQTLDKITSKTKSIGQKLREDRGTKPTEKDKEIYQSQKETLKIYKASILALQGAEKFIKKSGEGLRKHKLIKQKRGRGRPKKHPDTIFYNNGDDLCTKLNELVTAKKAGNTGLDNTIISALDELLNNKWVTKDEYDKLYKNIF